MDEARLEKIQRHTWNEIKKKFAEKVPFEAISPMATCLIRVQSYEPLIGLAVNAGHRVREECASKMAIEEEERQSEEDVYAEEFIANFPIQLIGLDSRYEYDVNRTRELSVYLKPFQSWGKKVWVTPPSKDEFEMSYEKYDEFHELIEFFVSESLTQFKKAVVWDVHSYNHKRQSYGDKGLAMPVFNLGTGGIDRKRHAPAIDAILAELKKVQLPGVPVTVKENDPFKGDGAVALNISKKFPEALVVSLEVKKIYVDETGSKVDNLTQKLESSLKDIGRKTLKL